MRAVMCLRQDVGLFQHYSVLKNEKDEITTKSHLTPNQNVLFLFSKVILSYIVMRQKIYFIFLHCICLYYSTEYLFVISKHEQHNTMEKSLELPEVRANELMPKYIIKFPVVTLKRQKTSMSNQIFWRLELCELYQNLLMMITDRLMDPSVSVSLMNYNFVKTAEQKINYMW